jgi:hypothetical protein
VDTCEEEKIYADRIRDQGAYFGIGDDETKALGRSKQDRWYGMLITADGKDLARELVRYGLGELSRSGL